MHSSTKHRSTPRGSRSLVACALSVASLVGSCRRSSTQVSTSLIAPSEDASPSADAASVDGARAAFVVVRGGELGAALSFGGARLLVVATVPSDVRNLWTHRLAFARRDDAPELLSDDFRTTFLSAFVLGSRLIVVTRTLDDSHVECCHGADHPDALDPPLSFALFAIDPRSAPRRLTVSPSLATDPLSSTLRSGELRFFAAEDAQTIVVRDARGVDRALAIDWAAGNIVGVRALRGRTRALPTLALRSIDGVEPLAFDAGDTP